MLKSELKTIKKYSLTHYQLAGYENKYKYEMQEPKNPWEKYDLALIKSILNGKPYKNRNPHLIPDSYISWLTTQLKFKDELELLWGNYRNPSLAINLFKTIYLDILNFKNPKYSILNDVLMDYIPYAKYFSYWQMFYDESIDVPKFPDSNLKFIPYFYLIKDSDIIGDFDNIKFDAIEFLFQKCQFEFEEILFNFIQLHGKSFKKLDKKLDEFVACEFSKMLAQFLPSESSLGLRVRNIIITDWVHLGPITFKKLTESNLSIYEIIDDLLIESSLEYIKNLERVQNSRTQFDLYFKNKKLST